MLNATLGKFKDWCYRQTFIEKLQNPVGLIAFLGIALVVTFATTYAGLIGNIGLMAVFIGVPVVLSSIFNHQLGLVIMLLIGYSVQFITKHIDAPVGTSMDAMLLLMLVGMLIQQIRRRDFSFAKGPMTPFVLAWIGMNLFQGFNPWAENRLVWIYTVRSMALLLMLYFIACNAFDSKKKVIWMINFILYCGLFAGLWAFKQEFIGFTAAEEAWLYADEKRFELIFQWTRYRLFSILNDPTAFGIMMCYMGVMTFVLAMGAKMSKKRIIWLVIMGLIMTVANSFSGTRTSMALLPFGFAIFVLLNPNRNVLLIVGTVAILGTAFVMKGTSNALVYRIQSAFSPTEDESMKVRIRNQAFIQPFIRAHPIGYGLGSCGDWAKRFNPNHWLAKFPHDSGYVRIAIEQGWIGLIFYLSLLVATLKTGIYYYFRVKDPQIKSYYLGLITVIFILFVANYPQEAIVQLPTSLVFYIFLAAIARLKDFDPAFNNQIEEIAEPKG
jgi:putative inorganic carbon (hco3(-)) transporter